MIKLKTRARGRAFAYERIPDNQIRIEFGENRTISIDVRDYERLIRAFRGQEVRLGTSRDNPPRGSVGEWLQQNVTKTAIASYVGPILVHEGHAEWIDDKTLRFLD